jgi:hypothetical protein
MVTFHFPARTATPQSNNFHVLGMEGQAAGAVAMDPVKLVWYDGGLRPPRPLDLEDDERMGDNGRLLVGTEGYILGNRIYPEKRRMEVGRIESSLPRVPQGAYREWSESCKTHRPAGSHFDWAGPLAETVLLGNVALRVQLREKLTRARMLWDTEAFAFTNVPEANAFLRRDYRAGWTLGG